MFIYEKRLEFPVKVHRTNAMLAKAIISQFGGPDGETGAAMRYLSQRFAMPYREGMGILTDIGTEELSHVEIICTLIHQLTRNLTIEQIKAQGFADYYVDHTTGLYPVSASGDPFTAATFQSTGDPITNITEDMAAEEKARTTYDNILRLVKDDPEVYNVIKFLRAREVVHFQRFGETLEIIKDRLNHRNFYAFNPAFDIKPDCGNKPQTIPSK